MKKLSLLIPLFGLIALALALFLVSWWSGDAGLAGAVVGAAIAGAIHFLTHRSEQLDRYRLAAIEKRLQAHQEAFALWRRLLAHVHCEDEIGAVVMECQTWWNNNCLYLEEKARTAFWKAYMQALMHKDLVKSGKVELVEKSMSDIRAAGDALADAIELPPVGALVDEYTRKS